MIKMDGFDVLVKVIRHIAFFILLKVQPVDSLFEKINHGVRILQMLAITSIRRPIRGLRVFNSINPAWLQLPENYFSLIFQQSSPQSAPPRRLGNNQILLGHLIINILDLEKIPAVYSSNFRRQLQQGYYAPHQEH